MSYFTGLIQLVLYTWLEQYENVFILTVLLKTRENLSITKT